MGRRGRRLGAGGNPSPLPALWAASEFAFDARFPASVLAAGGVPVAPSGTVASWKNLNTTKPLTSLDQASDPSKPVYLLSGINSVPAVASLNHTCILDNLAVNAFASGAARTIYLVAQASDGNGGHPYTFRRSGALFAVSYMSSISSSSISPLYWYAASDGVTINHQLNPPPPITTPFISVITYQSGNLIHSAWHNGQRVMISSQINTDTQLSTADSGGTGFTMFNRVPNPTLGFYGKIGCLYGYAGIDSAATIAARSKILASGWAIAINTTPSTLPLVCFDGDSLTRGVGASLFSTNYPSQVMALLGAGYDQANFALDGTQTAQIILRRPRQVDMHFGGVRTKTIYSQLAGTNDLTFSTAPSTIAANLSANAVAAKAAGASKTVVWTIPGRVIGMLGWDATKEAARVATNTLIKAGLTGVDSIVDMTGNTFVEAPTTSETPDGLHGNDGQYARYAAIGAPILAAL
jgi:hypothetical protein